jgi:hypothetical protein
MQGAPVGAPEAGRDAALLTSHNPAHGIPTQVNAALFQAATYDLHELVSQDGDEQMLIGALLLVVKHGAQSQFAFEAAKYRFQVGQHEVSTPTISRHPRRFHCCVGGRRRDG